MEKVLIILRGWPGSGKSTYAKQKARELNAVICSIDDYFINRHGEYVYKPNEVPFAHAYCIRQFLNAVSLNKNIIVDNINMHARQYSIYYNIGLAYHYQIKIKTLNGHYESIHDIPEAIIEKMKKNWPKLPFEYLKASTQYVTLKDLI